MKISIKRESEPYIIGVLALVWLALTALAAAYSTSEAEFRYGAMTILSIFYGTARRLES